MDTEEILLLKLSEEIRTSALEDNATRCEQKLSEMESLLDNSDHDETIEEIKKYRHEIKVSGVSDVASELVYFTDSVIGNYIGDSISNLGPVDKIIIEDSDIDLVELQERAGTNFIDDEALADKDPDQIVQREVISRFNLDLNIEDISGDLKILLAYMTLEYSATLDFSLEALADIHSKMSETVDSDITEFLEMRDDLDTAGSYLEEIVSDDEIKSTDEIKANRPPRVREELESRSPSMAELDSSELATTETTDDGSETNEISETIEEDEAWSDEKIGYIERVGIHSESGHKEVFSKSDPGATQTEVDSNLADQINIPITNEEVEELGATTRTVKYGTANVVLNDNIHNLNIRVVDRSHMEYPVLLGRDVLRNYRVDITRRADE